jgi:hypothetical protein
LRISISPNDLVDGKCTPVVGAINTNHDRSVIIFIGNSASYETSPSSGVGDGRQGQLFGLPVPPILVTADVPRKNILPVGKEIDSLPL